MFQALDLETGTQPDQVNREPAMPDCDTDSLSSADTASVTLPPMSPYTSPAFKF